MGNGNAKSSYRELEESLYKQEETLKKHLDQDLERDDILDHRIYNDNGILIYHGSYKNKKLHGSGKMFRQTGELFYEGEFEKGVPHGKGTLYLHNIRFVGVFNEAKLEGVGTVYYDEDYPIKKEVQQFEVKDGEITYK